jgi:tetraacyldisaccharide 4'-kinase
VLILDDGFQSAALEKDLSILVVDGGYGYGNGKVIPAGPLRETLERGHRRADAVVMLGEDTFNIETLLHLKFGLGAHRGRIVIEQLPEGLKSMPLLAFAGIGRPEKFFASLRQAGGQVIMTMPFADHHPYQERDLQRLQKMAQSHNARLVTTEKDFVRVPPAFQTLVTPVPAVVQWEDHPALATLLQAGLARRRKRV